MGRGGLLEKAQANIREDNRAQVTANRDLESSH
jgi:hypothetical protein